ncbi:predicted protein [Lichtheimia corymbifera JMRC:FSU:9682]|uniref:Uncharacterized protein n=2 Tax=Lichtheimia TaxID=688353 RepID=A0A068S7E3_9FUNG|nr:uncharacterized protein O0I10_010436 [Lichtheimia ornata]KAJ8653869.1 hypothetical protein O0I10_010436 [Lichtheimia ornata]CDH57737.1 predicted protein [Lichtheimia corymbifera JMRC:FSU:9682]
MFVVSSTLTRAALCRNTRLRRYYSAQPNDDSKKLIYTTPNVSLVKLAKLFSLSTFGISSVSTPAVMYFWESPAVQASGISSTMFLGALAASACSTGAIHYLLSPFVNNIYLHTKQHQEQQRISPNTKVTIETLDLLARKRQSTLALRDLMPSSGLLLTWTVNRKTAPKDLPQNRFWLDKRNGTGDEAAMRSMLRVINGNQDQRRVV